MPTRHFYFRLQLSRERFLSYYQGTASSVQVTSECGRRLQFPAARLRPFLLHGGISGRFRLTIDDNNRFLRLEKLDSISR